MPSPSSPPTTVGGVSDEQLTLLVAHAIDTHDRQPGSTLCAPWCHACKALAGLPDELLNAGRQHVAAIAAELRDFTS